MSLKILFCVLYNFTDCKKFKYYFGEECNGKLFCEIYRSQHSIPIKAEVRFQHFRNSARVGG